jgi:hypothetical protein
MPFLALLFSKVSITKILEYFLAAACLSAAFFSGYQIGMHKARIAESALKSLQDSYASATKSYNVVTEGLRSDLTTIQVKYVADMERLRQQQSQYQSEWALNLSKKDAIIANLKKKQGVNGSLLDELTKKLNAATSPEEKARLEAQVTELKAQLDRDRERLQGLECLTVEIPEEYVETLNGMKRGIEN